MSTPLLIPVQISFALTVDPRRNTIHDLQRDFRRESRRALLKALRAALAEIEKGLVEMPIACPRCGKSMRSRGRHARRIVTIFGSVDIDRARYGCRACGAVRRPLDEWIALAGTECTAAVREQALYLAADLPYERAAEVLRHVGGIGLSGRQIQRLLRAESTHIEQALGEPGAGRQPDLGRRFRRSGKGGKSAGVRRVLQLRQLKTSGLWDAYWQQRYRPDQGTPPARTPHRKADHSR